MPRVPATQAAVDQFSVAAREHHEALAPAARDAIADAFAAMRNFTQRRNESVAETKASFEELVNAHGGYPIDIVRDAVTAYSRDPQRGRFFPRAPAEMLHFSQPLLLERQRRAFRFRALAEEAERLRAEHDHMNAPIEPIPDDELRTWSRSMAETSLKKGWIPQEQFDRLFPNAETLSPIAPALGYDGETTT